jgi:hypothetical protein
MTMRWTVTEARELGGMMAEPLFMLMVCLDGDPSTRAGMGGGQGEWDGKVKDGALARR